MDLRIISKNVVLFMQYLRLCRHARLIHSFPKRHSARSYVTPSRVGIFASLKVLKRRISDKVCVQVYCVQAVRGHFCDGYGVDNWTTALIRRITSKSNAYFIIWCDKLDSGRAPRLQTLKRGPITQFIEC